MNPIVSVIVPVYNAEKYLHQTIQSVINQSYQYWELILINDGSTDNSINIIKTYLGDDRIKYISKANTGVSDTRNIGADVASGNYLCFLDADDIFLTDNIKEKVSIFTKYRQFALVHADAGIIDENGLPTGECYEGRDGFILDNLLLWQGTNIPGPSSAMIKKDVFNEVGKWDTAFSTAADQDLFFRVAAKYQIGRINKVLTSYRVLPDSMSRNILIMEKDHINVYKKAYKNGLFKSFWFKQQCFSNLYFILAGSWWVNGNNKKRGVYFLIKASFNYPPVLVKLIKKAISK